MLLSEHMPARSAHAAGLTLGGPHGASYHLVYVDNGLTVHPSTVLVTEEGSRVYGSATMYSFGTATLPSGITALSGSLHGCSTNAPSTTPVGSYTGTISGCGGVGLTGPESGNYTVTYIDGGLTITKAPLTVTPTPEIVTDSTAPTFPYAITGFVNHENSTVLATAPTCGVTRPHAAPGTYTITCSGGSAENYSFIETATSGLSVVARHPVGARRRHTTDSVVSPPVSRSGSRWPCTTTAGYLVTTSTAAVTVSLTADPTLTPLHGTATVHAKHGVADFAGLSIDAVGAGYTLKATSSSLAPAVSTPVSVSPSTVHSLSVSATPTATGRDNLPP